jgi:DNA recombination protein RmuC
MATMLDYLGLIGTGLACGLAALAWLACRQQSQALLTLQEQQAQQRIQDQAAQQAGFKDLDKGLALMQQALSQGLQGQDKSMSLITVALTQSANQQAEQLRQFADSLHRTQSLLNNQLDQLRASVEQRLKSLQDDNSKKLDDMRQTVDEKLQSTLESRLGESFKQVSERLEQVYKGLGEMQTLANGVGDLKRVLTNVKTRGTWGEMRLESLLEQMLTPEQYARNIKPIPGSNNMVEFAIRLPGRRDDDQPVWLPIDSKFPKEQYERLLDAFDHADAEAVAVAGKQLESALKLEAKSISEKYLSPPHTTDFGILFLPTEGLYAEVVKRAGLVDSMQRDHRVTVAGPVTLTTLLNALQLGFRSLALEKRSSEVWKVLGAVKTEFNKFGDVLAKTRDTLEKAAKNIEGAETRSRAMERKLRSVEALAAPEAQELLNLPELAAGAVGAITDEDE